MTQKRTPANPDMHFSVDADSIADEDYPVVRWTLEGTYNGGVPCTSRDAVGPTVALTSSDTARREDQKSVEQPVALH